MFALLKKLFGKSAETEVKVNPVIARAEAANVEAGPVKKPRTKKPAVKAKSKKLAK